VALEAASGDRAQAEGKQGHGVGDGQGDPGGGLRCQAWRGGGDDSDEAGGERAGGARGGAVAGVVLLGGVAVGRRIESRRRGVKEVSCS
jgi:hypothetical protein